MDILDATGNQNLQNDQVVQFLERDFDVLCVNMVDRTAAGPGGGHDGPVEDHEVLENRYVWIPHQPVTSEKLEEIRASLE